MQTIYSYLPGQWTIGQESDRAIVMCNGVIIVILATVEEAVKFVLTRISPNDTAEWMLDLIKDGRI